MFLTKKTWKKEYEQLLKMYLNWRDKTNEDLNTYHKRVSDLEEYKEYSDKKLIQLEKRINSIADYIQGPYTQQINKNFNDINNWIQKNILNGYFRDKNITKKDKKCSGSKQLKK